MFLLGVLARLILGLLCGGWVGCFTWILRGIGRVRLLCWLISCGVGCPVDLGVVGGLLVSWVRFDTGTPLAANQGLQRALEEPALVAGQRTAAKPRVKSNPLFSGGGIGLVFMV